MDLKLGTESENKLLGRKEISFKMSHKGKTPTVEEAKEQICKKLNLSPDLTVVVNINPIYGSTESEILVHTYSTKEAMNVEKKHLAARVAKKAAKGAKAAEAAPA
ncbi:MAG: 30S ribosomal protein S24e [Candidatus Micrarchaeota archaeon]|nr:30S ribosomal protein S24e [Candidatus Micrarchaeota archaeon]